MASSWWTKRPAVGAIGALVIGLARGRLSRRAIMDCLISSLRVSASIMVIVIGAYLFGYFLTITQATQKIVEFMVQLPIGAYGVLALIMIGYLILGAIMDELAMILLTVPIVFPVMMQLGFDPVWFGVISRDGRDPRSGLPAGGHERIRASTRSRATSACRASIAAPCRSSPPTSSGWSSFAPSR